MIRKNIFYTDIEARGGADDRDHNRVIQHEIGRRVLPVKQEGYGHLECDQQDKGTEAKTKSSFCQWYILFNIISKKDLTDIRPDQTGSKHVEQTERLYHVSYAKNAQRKKEQIFQLPFTQSLDQLLQYRHQTHQGQIEVEEPKRGGHAVLRQAAKKLLDAEGCALSPGIVSIIAEGTCDQHNENPLHAFRCLFRRILFFKHQRPSDEKKQGDGDLADKEVCQRAKPGGAGGYAEKEPAVGVIHDHQETGGDPQKLDIGLSAQGNFLLSKWTRHAFPNLMSLSWPRSELFGKCLCAALPLLKRENLEKCCFLQITQHSSLLQV